jgi:dolichyl-phosphate-mannose-protein mannosyltransferase
MRDDARDLPTSSKIAGRADGAPVPSSTSTRRRRRAVVASTRARHRWSWYVATLLIAGVGVSCLDHTRRSLSVTFDEPNHLAAGLEWWQLGTYRQWTENPPLARIAVAALPYASGMRLPPEEVWDPRGTAWSPIWAVGGDLLYGGKGIQTNLAIARLGTLPFFLLAVAVVWVLAGGARRPGSGLVAVGLTATLPPLVAHGALATTDMAFAAMFLLAVLAVWRWFEWASLERSVALGAAVALALLTKFTVLVFFPVAVAAFAVARRMAHLPARPMCDGAPLAVGPLLRQLVLAGLTAALVTWAGYRFSIGRVGDLVARLGPIEILPPPGERSAVVRALCDLPLPMPELFHGLLFLEEHSHTPPRAYLLGQVSDDGFFGFYPVTLALKTPLPLLVLLLAAVVVLVVRRRRRCLWPANALLLAALGVLAVSMGNHVNLGIRHVFVVLPLAAAAIGRASAFALATERGLRRRIGAVCVGSLVIGQAGVALGARATELGYVNAFAARDPGAFLLDSDLDWGQDLTALRREVRSRGIERLTLAYFGSARLCGQGFPELAPLVPGQEATGWVAISENFYRQRNYFTLLKDPCDPQSWYSEDEVPPEPFNWLRAYRPVTMVGTSIRLYDIPLDEAHPGGPR